MGAQQIPNTAQDRGVSFQLSSENIHVLILKPEDLAERSAILDTVLALSALKCEYQLVYLAAPRVFGASVDAFVFKSRGIGLLFYDERRIDETVPAHPVLPERAPSSRQDDKAVVAELASLKTMYLEMERTINQIRDDFKNLRDSHLSAEPPPPQVITTPSSFHQGPIHAGELPSYFANNPWLDVLSRRGEREPIAG